MTEDRIVQRTDAVDGTAIADGTGETIRFSVDGIDYVTDLGDENAKRFRKSLGYYTDRAAKIGGRRSPRSSAEVVASAAMKFPNRDPARTHAIREWARANGVEIGSRGRIPEEIVAAFDAAH